MPACGGVASACHGRRSRAFRGGAGSASAAGAASSPARPPAGARGGGGGGGWPGPPGHGPPACAGRRPHLQPLGRRRESRYGSWSGAAGGRGEDREEGPGLRPGVKNGPLKEGAPVGPSPRGMGRAGAGRCGLLPCGVESRLPDSWAGLAAGHVRTLRPEPPSQTSLSWDHPPSRGRRVPPASLSYHKIHPWFLNTSQSCADIATVRLQNTSDC